MRFTFKALILAIGFVTCQPVYATEATIYKYDARGRISQIIRTRIVNNVTTTVTTSYSHDNADNRSRVTTVVTSA